jgi:hypothetical protein
MEVSMEENLRAFIDQSKTGCEGKEIVSVEEIILCQAMHQEALANILVEKGIIEKEELMEEIKKLRIKYTQ